MKRTICMLLCITLLLTCLTACGGKSSKVSDSQLEYDVSNLYYEMQNDDLYESNTDYIPKRDVHDFQDSYEKLGSVSGWKATHDVNKDMYLDKVKLDLFFDEWIGTLQFTTTRVYQYSRERGIWELVDVMDFKLVGIAEYNTDRIKSIEGEIYSRDKCKSDVVLSEDYYNFWIVIVSVDPQSLTAEVEYNVDQYTPVDFWGNQYENCYTWQGPAEVALEIPDADGIRLNIPFGDSTLYVELTEDGDIGHCLVKL